MNLQIDKQNGKVAYNDLVHKYWNVDNNSSYISVTTLIEKFGQPYDKEFWSKYKALERLLEPDIWKDEKKMLLETHRFKEDLLDAYGIDKNDFLAAQQDILDEWDENNRISCERGTKIHAQLENSFYTTKHNISLQKYGVGGKFDCTKGQIELTEENKVYPEYLISWEDKSGTVKLAGQIDGLILHDKKIIILDWKTNKDIKLKSYYDQKTKKYTMMKYPLNNLMDTNYYHYNMQLSTYAWMINKKLPEYEVEDLVLVWFDHQDNMTVYHLPYLRTEVERMLKYYKKELIKQMQNDRVTPIIY